MLDIFSYFRRRGGSARRQPAAAGDDAIDLGSIGGVINGTYLDIASAPAAEAKARSKRPPQQPRQRPPERAPQQRPPPSESAPTPAPRPRRQEGNGAAPDRKGLLSVHSEEKTFVGRKVVRGVTFTSARAKRSGFSVPTAPAKPPSSI